MGRAATVALKLVLALTPAFAVLPGAAIPAHAGGSISPGLPNVGLGWGYNRNGALGNGTTVDLHAPGAVSLPSGTTLKTVSGGGYHSLALTAGGQVLAWGANDYGQLGDGNGQSTTPVAVSLPAGTVVTAIAAGLNHSLALTSSGSVLAWGDNSWGQLGDGTTNQRQTPVSVNLPAGTTVTAVAAGYASSLALTSTGSLLAWGDNSNGELGNGNITITNSSTPVPVSLPPLTTITAIASGAYHLLALTSVGDLLAWGYNDHGQLGNGTSSTSGCYCSSLPVRVSLPAGTAITAVAAGGGHSLALTSTGLLAWGNNFSGQLGNGTTTNSSTPVAVRLPAATTVISIAGGGSHTLALTSGRQLLAWGFNGVGQLGDGLTTSRATPSLIPSVAGIVAITGGLAFSLAVQLPVVAVFPAMSNGAYGGYVTAATIKNAGNGPALVRVYYYNQSGNAVGTGDGIEGLPVNASWTIGQDNGNSFPGSGGDAAQAGSAVVYSSQSIASFVNEFSPGKAGDATSYSGAQVPSGVGTTLYAPTIVNNAYGGYTTGIGLLNAGRSPTDVTITYHDGGGAVIKSQTVAALPGHAYHALYSGDAGLALPDGFAGTATITSTGGQPLGAIVNETGPGGQFSSYDAVPSGSLLLNLPVALNNAFGGYYTGIGIQNTSSSGGTVSVTYYDASGTPTAKSFEIRPNGSLGIYQGSSTDGPPTGAYTAVIQSSTVPMAAIVNEVAPGTGAAKQSTSYNTFSTGSSLINLPLVENTGSDPWNTGDGIMNTGSTGTTVTVTYYDAFDGTQVGTPQTKTLARRAFWGLYQPDGGLPTGSRSTAVITTSDGGQVAVICNESSASTFMSYDGQ